MKRTPLQRHAQLQRRTYLRALNPERKKRLYVRNFAGPKGDKDDWTRAQPCEMTGADPAHGWPIEAAHMDARGMGGCGGDYTDLVPLASWVHRDFDTMPEATFETKYERTKASVRAMAPVYHQRYTEEML